MPLLTLLTDFGLGDYYVAAVKGTVLRLAPGSQIVDISHDLAPGDVAAAAFLLSAAAPSFPAGTVHLAVVDPGVGSSRRMLAARLGQAGDAAAPAWFLAPDNGLLTPLLAGAEAQTDGPGRRWTVEELRSVERGDLFLDAPGQTFHGRDRFAPVAAALLRNEPGATLGPAVTDPVLLSWPSPRREERSASGRVVHVDRFGNLVTDLPSAWLPAAPFSARVGRHETSLAASHYAAIPPGQAAVVPGSLGTLELSLAGESLARHWQVARGTTVSLHWPAAPG